MGVEPVSPPVGPGLFDDHVIETGLLVKAPGFIQVFFHAITFLVHHRQGGQRTNQALLACFGEPFYGFLRVLIDTLAFHVHETQTVLRDGMALFSGSAAQCG